MHDADLKQRTEDLFRRLLSLVVAHQDLERLRCDLIAARERCRQPMQVAIVGLIKSGKSTLMNALLGEQVVPTGSIETTYNVTWLKHGDSGTVRVHFKDGRPAVARPLAELAALARRAAQGPAALDEIRHIEVRHPSPLLQQVELIDLPGLASFYGQDSQNAREFLRLQGRQLTEITLAEASQADTVLYLFSRGLHHSDQAALGELAGPALGQANPINSIGVLTKVDAYWPRAAEPLATGREIAARLAEEPRVRNLLYLATPVCGLLAAGAAALQAADLDTLRELAALPEERFERLLAGAARFADRVYTDVPVAPERRRHLLELMGAYGVHVACRLLRRGECAPAGLRRALVEHSGLNDLRELILAHFGRRALVIQVNAALRRLKAVCFAEQRRLAGPGRKIVEEIAGDLEAFELQDLALQELQVLRDLYSGKLDLDEDERREVLAVTGEDGPSARARLGLDHEVSDREAAAIAGEGVKRWQARFQPLLPQSSETLAAARVIARAYETLVFRLQPGNPFHLEEKS